jgi:hypothetical protein
MAMVERESKEDCVLEQLEWVSFLTWLFIDSDRGD